MERRWYPRISVTTKVRLNLDSICNITARVKNISKDGMLLDTGPVVLGRGTIVELIGIKDQEFVMETVRLRALTVHVIGGLAGIMFLDEGLEITALWDEFAAVKLQADVATRIGAVH